MWYLLIVSMNLDLKRHQSVDDRTLRLQFDTRHSSAAPSCGACAQVKMRSQSWHYKTCFSRGLGCAQQDFVHKCLVAWSKPWFCVWLLLPFLISVCCYCLWLHQAGHFQPATRCTLIVLWQEPYFFFFVLVPFYFSLVVKGCACEGAFVAPVGGMWDYRADEYVFLKWVEHFSMVHW